MTDGKISFTQNDKGNRVIDEVELYRVFGQNIKNRETKKIENGFDTGSKTGSRTVSASTENIREFYEMKANLQIAEDRVHQSQKRIYELEKDKEKVEQDRDSWRTVAERLALPSPKPVQESIISLGTNQQNQPVIKNETILEPVSKPSTELQKTATMVSETKNEPSIEPHKNSPTLSNSSEKTVSEPVTKPAVEPKKTGSGEGRGVEKPKKTPSAIRMVLRKLFGEKD